MSPCAQQLVESTQHAAVTRSGRTVGSLACGAALRLHSAPSCLGYSEARLTAGGLGPLSSPASVWGKLLCQSCDLLFPERTLFRKLAPCLSCNLWGTQGSR